MNALITGASAGLGAAFAAQLAADGTEIVNLDRVKSEAHETCFCDLSHRASLDAALPGIVSHGPFDWLILNAGASATGRFEELPLDAMLKLIVLNAEAPMVLANHLLKQHAIAKGGHIVLISSLSHFTGYPGAAAYAASKSALAIFGTSIRKAAYARGVSVTIAYPGPLATEHAARHAPKGANAKARMAPEIAAATILRAAKAGRKTAIPGLPNKMAAWLGRAEPGLMTWAMRKIIYERLDKNVY
jgi:cyclic-di-GMP-binding biofilm dispersal mediator protein